jgi:hypothetical protein
MSKSEWVAKQYGVLLGDGFYKQFATIQAATNEIAYLKFRDVPCTLAEREVHTTVTETPWVEIEETK